MGCLRSAIVANDARQCKIGCILLPYWRCRLYQTLTVGIRADKTLRAVHSHVRYNRKYQHTPHLTEQLLQENSIGGNHDTNNKYKRCHNVSYSATMLVRGAISKQNQDDSQQQTQYMGEHMA